MASVIGILQLVFPAEAPLEYQEWNVAQLIVLSYAAAAKKRVQPDRCYPYIPQLDEVQE